ncbi:prepilin peptidase [Nocardioides ferulae]|uniref:prepilin peptidase n=1 Tax=Nocardioides ferulae TaxID=2340821 RepID=UPI000EAEF6FB|nr:A24 family peptidase [Nocardioides ferulae]
MDAVHPLTALLAALACGGAGLLVPALIARIPEPSPVPVDELDPGTGTPPEAAAEPPAAKEPYAAIAALPGLRWRSAAAGAAAGGLLGGALGPDWALLVVLPLVPVSVALAVVDWRTRLLPTRVIAPTYLLTILAVLVAGAAGRDGDDVVRAFWGWLVAGGLFFLLWFVHPRGLGYGDVRLAGVLGIALGSLGWGPLLVGVYAGFLLGGLGGGLLSLLRIVERRAFPFGPFMLVGALVGVLWGEPVLAGLVGG